MVRAKKFLGQHFLKDDAIALRTADALSLQGYSQVLEIGPGTGALTKFLIGKPCDLSLVELDRESVGFLATEFPLLHGKIYEMDFLKMDLKEPPFNGKPLAIIGNFPYNISSQILFKIFEEREQVREVVGMFQKEVAERIAIQPPARESGILTILTQAFYKAEYLFTVPEHVFSPPPKVKSGVIRLTRNDTLKLDCDEALFKTVVKAGFNQRRKTLRNSLSNFLKNRTATSLSGLEILSKRAEQLSVGDFVYLTKKIQEGKT